MTPTLQLLRDELAGAAAVTALVGSNPVRIYPQLAPQGSAYPLVVITVIADSPITPLAGTAPADRLRNARVQVDSYAESYLDAHALADAVDDVLSALARPDLSATQLQKQDLYEDAPAVHRVSADYSVWR